MTSQLIAKMLTAAAPSIANHLWQSTVCLIAAAILTLALRKNQAWVRYAIWLVASVKFLIPFSLLIAAGGYLRPTTVAPMAPPVVSAVMEQMTQPFSQTLSPTESSSTAVTPIVVAQNRVPLPMILLSVWACGSLIVAFSWWRRWRTIRAAVREASYMTMVADVPVLSSPSLLEPGVFGIFRPVLLLPEDITVRLTESQLSAILAHEMCHVRRRDNFTAAVHMVVEAAFWFHPATWWISTRLVEERERACDEAVLRAGSEALVYAEGILNVCKFYAESPLVCVSGVTGSDLKKRIVRIMTGQVAHKLDFCRKLLLSAAGLLAVAAPVVFGVVHATVSQAQSPASNTARDIEGTWQGTLHADRDLRTVVKITKAGDGAYKAQLFSIDQGGQPFPVDSVTLDGPTVKMALNSIGASYEGKLSADGQSISGTWTLGQPFPLVLTRATPETAWTIPPPPPPVPPMADDADPSFEVATIMLSPPDQRGKGFGFNGHEFVSHNTSLNDLLAFAYGVHSKQIVNAPDWANSVVYDITGIPDAPGRPDLKQQGILIKKLLLDRFQLKTHTETRVLSVYAVTVAKDGPKMTKNIGPTNAPIAFAFRNPGNLVVRNLTMNDFATMMQSSVMDRPVVDQTGLTGRYDFQLKWTPDDSQFTQFRNSNVVVPPTNDNPNAPPNLYTAIQQQLGLKIEPAKAPDAVLVIDHIEKPSAN